MWGGFFFLVTTLDLLIQHVAATLLKRIQVFNTLYVMITHEMIYYIYKVSVDYVFMLYLYIYVQVDTFDCKIHNGEMEKNSEDQLVWPLSSACQCWRNSH